MVALTASKIQQTTAPSPFMVSNNIAVEPNNIWRPASLEIPGLPDHPDINLMTAYTLPPNPKIRYDLLGPTETRSIWPSPAVYPPHWDQKQIVFDAIVKAAKEQCNTVLISGITRTKPNKHKEMSYILICSSGRLYYAQGKTKTRKKELQPSDDITHHQPNYAPGLRMDRMVNKKKQTEVSTMTENRCPAVR
jgi:hypothetical protein